MSATKANDSGRCHQCGAEPDRGRRSLADRIALRPREAAAALGVCERTFRSLLPELPHVRRGNTLLVPIDALREWLHHEADAHYQATRDAAAALLGTQDGSKSSCARR